MRAYALFLVAGCRQITGLDDVPTPDAPPAEILPSNAIERDRETASLPTIRVSDIATFDTDTGQVTGAVVRAAGEGIVAGIAYHHADFGGAGLAVFAMSRLDVAPAGVIRLQGSRAAVLLVDSDAIVEGTIDGTGGCADPTSRSCGGPGGGTGGSLSRPATGCSPGQPGTTHTASGADSGGGGGGAGFPGGAGGDVMVGSATYPGGAAAPRCMTSELEPLLGGGGGGGGGRGTSPQGSSGGGGGGALQLTAFGSIAVSGTITMAGAGGEGGTASGAGAGGGGGGSILLEAPLLTVTGTLAANGGGGGGAASMAAAGQPGQSGIAKPSAASGGAGAGGAGGALDQPAQAGASMTNGNAGGGGGGAGRIFLRGAAPAITDATITPAPGLGALRLR